MAFQYEKAPIIEAIIDIRAELPQGIDRSTLETIYQSLREEYPIKKDRVHLEGQFSTGEEVGATAKQRFLGLQLMSPDETRVLQVRLDGFTVSRFRPYSNWIELRDEAHRLWKRYCAALTPRRVERVAVRYINRIEVPAREIDYAEYFQTIPSVSQSLPQAISSFFMQLQFPLPDALGTLVLTQAAVPPTTPGTTAVVLDIDAYKELTDPIADDAVWSLLESLRLKKNQFFEGSITEKARSLFGRKIEYSES